MPKHMSLVGRRQSLYSMRVGIVTPVVPFHRSSFRILGPNTQKLRTRIGNHLDSMLIVAATLSASPGTAAAMRREGASGPSAASSADRGDFGNSGRRPGSARGFRRDGRQRAPSHALDRRNARVRIPFQIRAKLPPPAQSHDPATDRDCRCSARTRSSLGRTEDGVACGPCQ